MERHDAALFRIRETVLSFEPDDDTIDSRVQLGHPDFGFLAARCEQRGFVEHVLEVGTYHARRAARDVFEVDVACQLYFARMNLEDRVASSAVRPVDEHL